MIASQGRSTRIRKPNHSNMRYSVPPTRKGGWLDRPRDGESDYPSSTWKGHTRRRWKKGLPWPPLQIAKPALVLLYLELLSHKVLSCQQTGVDGGRNLPADTIAVDRLGRSKSPLGAQAVRPACCSLYRVNASVGARLGQHVEVTT